MHYLSKIMLVKELKYVRKNVTVAASSMLTIKDMPRPKELPVIGTQFDLFAAGGGTKLHQYIDMRHKKLGPIFCENLGGTELVFTSDAQLIKSIFLNLDGKYPEHILPEPWLLYEKLYGSKRGLLFMHGEEWLNCRRIMNKYLLQKDAEKWFKEPVKETVENFIENWKNRTENDTLKPDIESDFYKLSLDVIAAVLSGSNSSLKTDKHYQELMNTFSNAVKRIFVTTTKFYGLPAQWFQKLDLKVWKDFRESVDISLSLARRLVKEMLTQSSDSSLINNISRENINEETIKRIISDLIIAAGDTTAYTLVWTLLLLSKNKETAEEIRLKGHSYVKFAIRESMRLFPVAPFLTRILPKESTLGPYVLKEGTPIIASIYTSGREEKYFSKADAFLPYRWDRNDPRKETIANHEPSASLPFAMGVRSCIGKKIAMELLTEAIYQIVENFDLECINKGEINGKTSQILIPDKQVEIMLSIRNRN